jgi:hypothetical protein
MHLNHLLLSTEKDRIFFSSIASGPNYLKLSIQCLSESRWFSSVKVSVHLDPILEMSIQINQMCQTCYLLLWMLWQICSTLDWKWCLLLANALICSCIEYCNSLLFKTKGILMEKLQHVMNLTAKIVIKSRQYDHITPHGF